MGVNGIYGLSGSGLDIESMVKVGMMGKQKELDKLQQKTDLATWKKEEMSSVYSDLSTYNYSTLTQYKLQSNMNAMSATSSDESIVKVTANGSAASMTHKVSVEGLSSNAYLITANKISRNNTSAGSSIYLSDNLFSTGSAKTGEGTIYTIGGKDYLSLEQAGVFTEYSADAPVYAINGKEYSSVEKAGVSTEYHVDSPVYTVGGKQYSNVEQVGVSTEYKFTNKNDAKKPMYVRRTVDANNNVTYQKSNTESGYNWVPMTNTTEINNAKELIRRLEGSSTGTSSVPIQGYYYVGESVQSATFQYTFTGGEGSDTYNFTANTPSNANTTYKNTYTDDEGASYTAGVAQIAHDFSNLASNSVEHELTVRRSVEGNVTTYQKKVGDEWVTLTGNDETAIAKLLSGASPKEKIGDWYYNNPTATGEVTDYVFSGGEGTDTYSFTAVDPSHPETTAYTYDGQTISHDLSNLGKNSEGHALTLRKSVDGEGNDTYQIKEGSEWKTLEGDDKTNAATLLSGTPGKVKIGDWYYTNPNPTGEVIDYAFKGIDGTTDTFSFTALDPSNPDTTAYSKTYRDGNGTVHTSAADKIEHDFSNFINGEKYISNGKIVGDDDVAVSFTVMDGSEAEELSKMTEAEKEEFTKKRTITYTYGQLTSGGKTYNDLAADINALGTNIKASYDAANDSFSLTNKNSGADNKIQLTMNTELAATLFNNLGLMQSKNGVLSKLEEDDNSTDAYDPFAVGKDTTAKGDSGKITIDGKTYDNVEDNRITVDGVTYQLQNVSGAGAGGTTYNFTGTDADGKAITGSLTEASGAAKTVNVVITQNTDAIIDKVKSFVEDYNKLLDGLYEKYSETKYSDYKPLTESQRDKMTDKQIEKWEEKAKSGLLYHDRTIGSIIDKIRTALATPVDGLDSKYNSAYALGIYTSKTNGHIALDEDKLKKALAEDPEAAYNVFGTLPDEDKLKASISNSKGEYDKSRLSQMMYDGMGVAQRLGDVMAQAMKNVKTEAGDSADFSDGSNLGNKIMEFQQKMSDFKTLMSAFESRLFKKYDAMESLLATLGAQMNYITGGQ